MKNSILLTASIASAFAQSSVAQDTGEPPADLGTIVVTAPPLEPPRVIYLGSLGNGSDTYFWHDTEQGNQGGGGTITPADFENPDPENAAICALMSLQGFPEDCTRSFVNAGPPSIAEIADPWQLDVLRTQASNSGILRLFFNTSHAALRNCYADQANDPIGCETSYRTTIRGVCQIYAAPYATARNDMTDRELCLAGADNIDGRMANVAGNRVNATWYAELQNLDVPLRFQVFIALGANILTGLDQYNSLLFASRKWQNCATIIEGWDANECGTNLPS